MVTELSALSNGDEVEMFQHFHFTIDPGQEPLRIDKYLIHKIPNVTRTRLQYAMEAGIILVNSKHVKPSYKVKPGENITVVFPYPKNETRLIPQDIPLDITYEDEDIIIVNKKAGMVVHPAAGNDSGTLMNALMYHLQSHSQSLLHTSELRPGLLHRIDKDTSGLLVIAKNDKAMNFLAKQFYEKTIQRKYTALAWGIFKEDEGTINMHIGRDMRDRKKMAGYSDGSHGKPAITHYKVLERFRYITLLECRLETGRTHQIRVHLAKIGHPVFNDKTYGGAQIRKGLLTTKYRQFIDNCFELLPRQALHAQSLGFIHPSAGKFILFESPLPSDMKAVIEKWRKYDKGITGLR